ncbi:hypothetical protein [Campylobacter sp.]|uniref:hypothetical protein n=1 Tax=Campylobacter sp. TaxID=205 RepID=UPI0026FE6FC3|nr:hypothetical protein [Campylobacter sp.]
MTNVGFIKEIFGNVLLKDDSGKERVALVDGVINAGDMIITNSDNDRISLEFNGRKMTLSGEDTLKIDQSIISDESFGSETDFEISSINEALNLVSSDFVADGEIFDLEVLNSPDEFEFQALNEAGNAASIPSHIDDAALDLSKIEKIDGKTNNHESNTAGLEAISANDLLDIDATSSVIKEKSITVAKASSEGSFADNSCEVEPTISIKIENDIQTDFS